MNRSSGLPLNCFWGAGNLLALCNAFLCVGSLNASLVFIFFHPRNIQPLAEDNLWSLNNFWSSVITEFIESEQPCNESLKTNSLLREKARSEAYYRKEPNNPVCCRIRLGQTNYWSSQPRAAHLLTALLTIPSHSLATYQDGKEVASHQNYLWAPFLTAQFNHFSWSLVSDQGQQLI